MKSWMNRGETVKEREIEREIPRLQPMGWPIQCIYGPHQAELLHRGTAYCRSCYDEKCRLGKLLDQ